MLRSLELAAFKGFNDHERANFAPITLIYGANSSGKSSILQSLLLLKQTLLPTSQPDATLVFRNNEFADLGNFENVVYGHNKKRHMEIGIGIDLPVQGSSRRSRSQTTYSGISDARVRFTFTAARRSDCSVDRVEFFLDDDAQATFSLIGQQRSGDQEDGTLADPSPSTGSPQMATHLISDLNPESATFQKDYERTLQRVPAQRASLDTLRKRYIGLEPPRGVSSEFRRQFTSELRYLDERIEWFQDYTFEKYLADVKSRVDGRLFRLAHFLPILMTLSRSVRTRDFRFIPDEDLPVIDLGEMAIQMLRRVRDEITQIGYIGPLRSFPERTYIFSGSESNTVGTRGQNLPHILFASEALNKELNRLANLLELGYEVKVAHTRVKALNDVFAVRLVDKKTRIDVGLNDVGFGVSQVLPVLLEGFLSPRSTVLIEQPEIHLHPKLQASLADVFASAVNRFPGRQFIIETHSEHLFLRLKSLIRSRELKAQQLRVLFVRGDAHGAHIESLRVSDDGDMIDPWPNGFFDDAYHEVFSALARPATNDC